MVQKIIEIEGLPKDMEDWLKTAQKFHAWYAMSIALTYTGEKKGSWQHALGQKKRPPRDPDAMDVDFTQMSPGEKERLMKSGSCFRCKKQGHLSWDCPAKGAHVQEAEVKPKEKKEAPKATKSKQDKPPSYESLAKQIQMCSLEDWEKLLEHFSMIDEEEDIKICDDTDFWKAQLVQLPWEPTL